MHAAEGTNPSPRDIVTGILGGAVGFVVGVVVAISIVVAVITIVACTSKHKMRRRQVTDE